MLKQGEYVDDTYEIIKEIGKGGAGIVYLAYHTRLQKKVVIKKIKDDFVGRINERGEVDILKSLHHQYLPQVYDFVQRDTEVYTVIDYIEGYDLMYYIKKGVRFEEKRILIWLDQLCQVLDYLHSQRPPIIHSDIKPSNIMISNKSDICLIDFNVSFDQSDIKQISGYSRSYASPEQIYRAQLWRNGRNYQNIRIDARSDIYSLGATFYELMIGMKPALDANGQQPSLIKRKDLPYTKYLLGIIEKAMNKNPMSRYQSAKEMRMAVNNISEYKKLKRGKTITYTCCAVLLTMGIVLVGLGIRERHFESFQEEYKALEEETKMDDYDRAIEHAISILNDKNYSAAMKKNSQEKADILYMIANCYFEQDDYRDAAMFYKEAVSYNETNAEYFRDYAIALARDGDIDQAKEILEQAKSLNLGEDHIYLVDAEIELAKGNGEEAIKDFKQAISTTSNSYLQSRAYILCGRAYRTLGEYEEAVDLLTEATQYVADDYLPETLRTLGSSCLRCISESGINEYSSDYIEKAKKCYNILIEENQATFNDYMNLASLYQMNDEYGNAKDTWLKMTELYPNNYRVYMKLSFLEMLIQGEKVEADRDYSKAQEYYEQAKQYYDTNSGQTDAEMQQLETKIQELYDKDWL